MKYPICLLIACLSLSIACKSINGPSVKSDAFTLLEATSQDWTAGVQGGGKGTEYYFKVHIATSRELQFDSAWINNGWY